MCATCCHACGGVPNAQPRVWHCVVGVTQLTSFADYCVRCVGEAVQAERANAGGKKGAARSRTCRT
ncbi:hypothetical protein P350_32820 [Burkholderia cepacia JBK9]|uniref:hypothetical protein n=1 Tax=Burkholderia arboris TaxID=488730 RepID=UPI0004D365A9|nr:hypothetical protein [Burkholderia arboris]ALX16455.1 hypothetical protein P350_32820 [Burkholderia cepacia JBK9]MCA8489718.1 hypothetical protein [Burkholderia arboris]